MRVVPGICLGVGSGVSGPRLLADLLRAVDGLIIERASVLQPRDRRPVPVRIDVSALAHARGDRVELRWVLSPTIPPRR
jgi:hypothetical protein